MPRDEHRFGPGSDRAGQFGQRRPAGPQAGVLRQVVTIEPEPVGVTGVAREYHDVAGDALHLAQARDRVLPVISTVRASPSAAQTCAAIRGSVRRVTV
jgi:hypothetical protein